MFADDTELGEVATTRRRKEDSKASRLSQSLAFKNISIKFCLLDMKN